MEPKRTTLFTSLSRSEWKLISKCIREISATERDAKNRRKDDGEKDKGGRPKIDDKKCFEGILWLIIGPKKETALYQKRAWRTIPRKYAHHSSCYRRLNDWNGNGNFRKMWNIYLTLLSEETYKDLQELTMKNDRLYRKLRIDKLINIP